MDDKWRLEFKNWRNVRKGGGEKCIRKWEGNYDKMGWG